MMSGVFHDFFPDCPRALGPTQGTKYEKGQIAKISEQRCTLYVNALSDCFTLVNSAHQWPPEGVAADWTCVTAAKIGHVIELKGSDYAHACEQLAATIRYLRYCWPSMNLISPHVVISGHHLPKMAPAKQIAQRRFKSAVGLSKPEEHSPGDTIHL